jgi:hypothetical protein
MNNSGMEECEDQEIDIHSVGDIIALRMAVRQFARKVGLDLTSQSSISLATSHLAYKLGMDTRQDGHIRVLSRHEGYRVGVQLLVTMKLTPNQVFTENTFSDIRGLIDELYFDISPIKQITVRMVKWTHSWQVAF